jgi:hypothetical protein
MMVVSIIDARVSQFLGVFGGSDLPYGSPYMKRVRGSPLGLIVLDP